MKKVYVDSAKETAKMVIDGHEITFSFASHPNPTLAQVVKENLIDSYIRRSSNKPEMETA